MPGRGARRSIREAKGTERPIVSIINQASISANAVSRPVTANDVPIPGQILRPALLPPTYFPIFSFPLDEEDPLYSFKVLFKAASTPSTISMETAFVLFLNILELGTPNLIVRLLKPHLVEINYEVLNDVNFHVWVAENEDLEEEDFTDLGDYEGLNQHHIQALWGLIYCFIGRNLTTDNATQWINRRKQAFANACGTDPMDTAYNASLPSQQFAASAYASVQARFEIRRELFQQLRGRSKTKDNFSSAAQVTMTYLSGTELNNFLLINRYILVENPVLLAWNELQKHAWTITAAYKKWQSLGEDAPYCKFLYHKNDLMEFSRNKLSVLSAVARGIAETEGQQSLQFYKGTTKNDNLDLIVSKALLIVDHYGGAQTHESYSIDRKVLTQDSNEEIRRHLRTGANIAAPEEDDSEEEEENPAV